MSRHYILVDFENVQPSSLGVLKPGDTWLKVFAGQHQSRVDLSLAQALQPFGAHAEYLQIVGNGKDALDFHIAFYIGRISAEHPSASFTIVSRDTGFDPLVKHLEKLKIACKRVATIPGASVKLPATATPVATPAKKAAAKVAKKATKKVAKAAAKAPAVPARLQEVIDRLANLKHARPGTLKTLGSTLASFNPPIEETERDAIVDALAARGILAITGTKVTYPDPIPHPKTGRR
jgi:hypothetical protein